MKMKKKFQTYRQACFPNNCFCEREKKLRNIFYDISKAIKLKSHESTYPISVTEIRKMTLKMEI